MSFQFSDEQQTLTVYHYDASTGEYLSSSDEVIPPHTGLPADCTETAPPEAVTGYAWIYTSGAWLQVEDHRGTTVYVKASRVGVLVTTLGALLDTVTTIAPATEYDAWNATTGAWEVDTAAKLAAESEAAVEQVNTLMGTANQQVDIYTDAVSLPTATDEDTLMFTAWKTYRVALNKVDTTDPENIVWPTVPTLASVTAAA
ncbi:tail fiber assembly protein [Pantoea stewartii]|uniref:Putative tail fiber chaperone n=1 Tax=Pantoea stewartii subsp. stewartii DC283 TaxID=660596 RepID=H3RLP2_PANSE|nr:tail fiber assembly protein [Pantoea stewartii]ARF52797.1 hypothetical protein DSJ_26690 [Pantoea stewartii subsp. stewartii DC283]EHT97755.1 putative tail fiber chaperone [Pantoea stewartii subsp. stewartii DC283]KAB0553971.1 tail fiber assembly protein [Pantoea stewartii subsp. stewartii]